MTVTSEAAATLVHVEEGWDLVLPLDPVPAAWPRVGKWGTFYPKTYATWKARAHELLEPLALGVTPTPESVHVSVAIVCTRPKTGRLPAPRGDVDNYAKAVLDAVNKAQCIWCDDKQVETLIITKRYALGGEPAHARVKVGLTMGVVWLMEHLVPGEDIFDRSERLPLEALDLEM